MKNKFLFVGAVCILAVAIMASAGLVSGAWFSDSAITPGSIISSGTLDLSVTGEPLKVSNLAPFNDYISMGTFCTQNIGTTDLKYRGIFESEVPASNDLLVFMAMKVELQTEPGWTTLKEIFGSSVDDPLQNYFKFPNQDETVVNQDIISGALISNQQTCYRLSVKLDDNTPNYNQNKGLDFILHLYATQSTNPGWE